MRGLTAEEYAFMLQAIAPRDMIMTSEQEAVAEMLRAYGRLAFVIVDDDWIEVRVTPAGHKAVRIYQALRAVE